VRVERKRTIEAPAERVWEIVSQPDEYLRFFSGVTRWECVSEERAGRGARYDVRFAARAAEVGSLVEIVEFDEGELAWTSITGIDQRGRWRVRQREEGRTEVSLRLAYQAPGGLLGTVSDRVSQPIVARHVERTLENLKRIVEGKEADDVADEDRGLVAKLEWNVTYVTTFMRAGLVRAERPDRIGRLLLALRKWGRTPATGYIAGAIRYGDREAIVDELGTLTWREVDERTNALANEWLAAGVEPGDGVAIMCRNHRYFIEATAAASKIGANALYLNTAFAGPQLRDVVKREKPKAIVYDEEFTDLLDEAAQRRKRFIAFTDASADERRKDPTVEELIERGDRTPPEPPPAPSRQIILTSGTTGTPKGATRPPFAGFGPAVSLLSKIPLKTGERWFIVAPLFHSWGFAHFNLGLLMGSTYVLRRRFDPEDTLRTIEATRPASAPMVPVMAQRIMELPKEVRSRYDTSSLRAVPFSGSALPGELATRFMDEFGDVAYNLYGSTEVAWATIATPRDLRAAPGTAGKPPPGTVVRILDGDGRECQPGETGRIFVRNELLFEGYTGGGSKDMVEGLMATGDVGHLDDAGRLFVSGRDDEMIVSGGENVFPREVEDLLSDHAAIAEAAVIGVDDEQFGQRLKAFVVTREGQDVSEADLKGYVKENLARYKVPREIEFLDELPRNATGKILKRELVEREKEASEP
jgi:acyl-CoA synthetase (AMP-forming)/AMP-acid ligase II/ribosome-associated toxin RatA of RatAB toxin-antitoxin module